MEAKAKMKASGKERKKKREQGKIIHKLLKAPVKFLATARDLYVKSMVVCDGQMDRYGAGGAIGCPTTALAGSFCSSWSSGRIQEEEFGEVGKAAACRGRLEELGRRSKAKGAIGPPRKMARSFSVIDEDEVCEFGEEVMVRTQSYAHARRKW